MKLAQNDPVENLYMMMLKQLLGVRKKTTNIGVLLELGKVPLELYGIKNAIKNWERIRKKEGNPLVTASYKSATQYDLLWIESIKTLLETNGMLSFYQGMWSSHSLVYRAKLL